MVDDWFVQLTRVRSQLGVSQRELAARAHVSPAAIKSYESGRRHPSRPYLTAILDALKVERGKRNDILAAAGFAPDSMNLVPGQPRGGFSHAEAADLVRNAKWPAFVVDEYLTVVATNDMVQRLWGVDFRSEFPDPLDRNLLGVASDPRFAERCANWDEAFSVIAAVFKQKEWGAPEHLENPSPAFAAVLQRFLAGDPRYVARLVDIWQVTPATPWDRKMRWSYPVVWRDPDVGLMRFEAVVSVANHADSTNFNDWIPLDAATWLALDRIAARAP